MKESLALMAATPALAGAPSGIAWALSGVAHVFGNEGIQKVTDAIVQARTAAVPWISILAALLPLVFSLFTGGTINLQTIIDAILKLITPTPTPAV